MTALHIYSDRPPFASDACTQQHGDSVQRCVTNGWRCRGSRDSGIIDYCIRHRCDATWDLRSHPNADPMDADSSTTDHPAASLDAQRIVATLAAELQVAAARAAHAQWATLAASVTAEAGSQPVIDPEALLLLSLWLQPHDAPLGRTVHEWVAQWSDLLSVQRTRNIAKVFPAVVLPELHALAETAYEQGKDFRWAPILTAAAGRVRRAAGEVDVADGAGPDAPRAAGQRLPSDRTALLVLRFRMAFGVGARADALAYLMARGDEWSTVTGIAQATGYTPSAIRRALDRMAAADIVLMLDDGTTRFRCAQAPWAALLALPHAVPAWRYWLQHFVFVAAFVTWADDVTHRKLTASAITEQLRQLARPVHVTDDPDARRAWEQAFAAGATLAEMEPALRDMAQLLRLA